METGQRINKRAFYKEKVSLFRDYAGKYPDEELFPIFSRWADTNEIYGIERHEIWRRARKLGPVKVITIAEGSEEDIRIRVVFDILLEADLARLSRLIEKNQKASVSRISLDCRQDCIKNHDNSICRKNRRK